MARNVEEPSVSTPLDELWRALKSLRECKLDTRQGLYDIIFNTLEYNKKIDLFEQEAFLIKVANRRFGEYTPDADIALMALGLLEGYEYHFFQTGKNRRIKYLRKSPYLMNSEGKDASYDKADDSLKNNYEGRLRRYVEPDILLEMADFMLKPPNHTEEFITDVGDYINGKTAIFPIPGYIKRKRSGCLNIILNYLVMGRRFSRGKGHASLNENSEYEMDVPWPENLTITVATSIIILCVFSTYCVSQYIPQETQKDNGYVAMMEVPKQDYGIPLAKQELPNID